MPAQISDALKIYNLDELSELLDIHVITLQRLCKTGQLKATRIARRWRVTSTSLEAFLKGENEGKMDLYLKRREQLFRN
jgi:excisionase family DNA binding protein